MALSLNVGRPMAEGIPGGTSSEPVTPEDSSAFIKYSDGNICLLEPAVPTEPQTVEDDGDEETISASTDRPTECGRTAGGMPINFWCTDEHSSVIYSKCHSLILNFRTT
ncbi:hypothetical protein AMELA_G00078750 [Ameiurus melas]|uniref:Uncharacterized protein n=1 Tax=Ameiurus melas TaxID=219545 RepID=A0A7J6AYY2_AMEME|nr:hypothetical protein AMELA_G00078750 [Ameiurus melas]